MPKIQWKGGALLAPVPPVLVTSGTLQNPNICTVAWCGMLSTKPPTTYVSLRPSRLSHDLITKSKEFVLNLPPSRLVRSIDFCGVKSGRELNKWEVCGLTPLPSDKIATPMIAECPINLECRVTQVIELGSHNMFIAEILAVHVNEELMDVRGRLNLGKAGLAAYAHGEYFALGKKVGSFGFSVRKKRKNNNRNAPKEK